MCVSVYVCVFESVFVCVCVCMCVCVCEIADVMALPCKCTEILVLVRLGLV